MAVLLNHQIDQAGKEYKGDPPQFCWTIAERPRPQTNRSMKGRLVATAMPKPGHITMYPTQPGPIGPNQRRPEFF